MIVDAVLGACTRTCASVARRRVADITGTATGTVALAVWQITGTARPRSVCTCAHMLAAATTFLWTTGGNLVFFCPRVRASLLFTPTPSIWVGKKMDSACAAAVAAYAARATSAGAVQRALRLRGPSEVAVKDVPLARLCDHGQGDDAILAVELAGVCGSDLHLFFGREACAAGVTMGHEAVGVVVALGALAARVPATLAVGDRVIVPFTTACGTCPACASGLSARCVRAQLLGFRAPVFWGVMTAFTSRSLVSNRSDDATPKW